MELYLLIPEIHDLSSTLIIAVIIYGICNLVIVYCRIPGVAAMKRCFPTILPAQEFLLPSNSKIDTVTKQRYYKFLKEHIDEFKISNDDAEMIPYVSTAVTWLITKTRDSTKFPLIAEENAIFGFSYNLLGLKAHGITVSCIGIITNIILMYLSFTDSVSINISKILVGFVIHFLFLLLWIFIITKKLVDSSGQKYASALLSACDSNDID